MAVWFTLCALIHTILEGYFVVFCSTLPSDLSFLGQAWKEYALADSRYVTGDSAVWVIEAITAFLWGPASAYIAYKTIFGAKTSSADGQLIWLKIVVSLGQLYGCVLYYATTGLGGYVDVRPEPLFFWVYFVGCNAPWIIVPCLVLFSCFNELGGVSTTGKARKSK
jgi:cholestenol delta-isomerase